MRERKFSAEVVLSCIQLGALAISLMFCVRNTIFAKCVIGIKTRKT